VDVHHAKYAAGLLKTRFVQDANNRLRHAPVKRLQKARKPLKPIYSKDYPLGWFLMIFCLVKERERGLIASLLEYVYH